MSVFRPVRKSSYLPDSGFKVYLKVGGYLVEYKKYSVAEASPLHKHLRRRALQE